MQKRHYVEKIGYWVYDSKTKTVSHQLSYPYHSSDSWVYVSCRGHIVTDDKEIIEFFPEIDSADKDRSDKFCYHSSKEYIGFTDKFNYCEKCGIKL
jgi:hypothetical protein